MSTEVFVPSSGSIVMKDNLAHGLGQSMDTFRKAPPAKFGCDKLPSRRGTRSRPGTQGTGRFGAMSHNSFFARHNPHPVRVRHIKGLLDVPICAVNDEVLMADPRYSLQWPPNNHEDGKIKSWSRYHFPANSINVNTQMHPINTITGLQYFLGRPLNMRIFREAYHPRQGMTEVPDKWQDELRALTEAVLTAPPHAPAYQTAKPPSRQKTQYSEATGRLIPPPSRAMSRGPSRQASRGNVGTSLPNRGMQLEEAESELKVMQLLCQILQTEDINAVKQWLVGAGEREKTLVMDLLKSALEPGDEPKGDYILPPGDITGTLGDSTNHDRLTLDNCSPRPMSPLKEEIEAVPAPTCLPPLVQPCKEQDRPVTSDAFRSSRQAARPGSQTARPLRSPTVANGDAATMTTNGDTKFKYTNANDTWNQEQSTL